MKRCGGLLLTVLTAGAVSADLPPWLLERFPGQSWQQDTPEIWRETGTNRGETWRQDSPGVWRGSGKAKALDASRAQPRAAPAVKFPVIE